MHGPAGHVTAWARLAEAVTSGGGTLLFHGDFDWPGIAIAASVLAEHGARPWRMTGADCRAEASAGEHVPLSGQPRDTPQDPALAAAMRPAGRAVYEESVVPSFLSDLRGSAYHGARDRL